MKTRIMRTHSSVLDALDRRRVAVHEAGHLVVARHLGYEQASSWTNTGSKKGWVGIGGEFRSERDGKLFGVAGGVAVCC